MERLIQDGLDNLIKLCVYKNVNLQCLKQLSITPRLRERTDWFYIFYLLFTGLWTTVQFHDYTEHNTLNQAGNQKPNTGGDWVRKRWNAASLTHSLGENGYM